ncbi:MAG: radical SAM protein [Candidatus Pacearchaeota archaeon]|jgi:hypothetical protein
MDRERGYLFLESTTTLCSICEKRIPGKIIEKEGKIFVLKHCFTHGEHEELLEEDSNYYKTRNEYTKPGTKSLIQTKIVRGCPYDCGLCNSHDQHTCIGLIEVTNDCDLNCPVCYANSGKKNYLDLKILEKMMDFYQTSENNSAEVLQISGGEPTMHKDILKIIKMALEKKFKYVMLNTNGLRISQDKEFVNELAKFKSGFEIYLQFDGFDDIATKKLRGKNIIEMKLKAMTNLIEHKIPITIVSTIERGVNDKEIGKIVEFSLNKPGIRGINFQPVAYFGRINEINTKNRITITGIISEIEKQTNGLLKKSDFFPLPCDVDRVSVNYMYRDKNRVVPLTRKFDPKKYLGIINNTFNFNADELKEKLKSCSGSCCNYFNFLSELKFLIPKGLDKKSESERKEYYNNNTFRISITSFVDRYNFDMKSIQKECVHILTPDLKKIPFSTYNMIYRKMER